MATEGSRSRRGRGPSIVPGAVWYGAMVAVWSIFFTLLVVSPETLENVYDWLGQLAIVLKILMWIVLLPWALAWLLWETSWEHWLRLTLLVLLTTVHLAISAPKR